MNPLPCPVVPRLLHALWLFSLLLASVAHSAAADATKPNILWLSSEDHGPHMGCYGDTFATTPNVDALAKRGMIYAKCWSNAPVCAPARTTIITGMYPTSLGAEHMRSMVPFPAGKKMFPQLLRTAGYYCSNNAKEDYNIEKPGQVWDESSKTAHWRKRGLAKNQSAEPTAAVGQATRLPSLSGRLARDSGESPEQTPAGESPAPLSSAAAAPARPAARQPFFAVFNSLKSHESQIRTRPHTQVHDPAKVRVPAYHPDTPEVRQDWAQYYDQVTEADADAGARLAELEKDGLTEDTIVFYFADHGSGMPRSKRWPYNSGLQVPLVVYIPEKFAALRPPEYKAGGKSERLVSFVDFAPTMLSLIGVQPPEWMQGHAFLGKFIAEPQPFLHGFRGRMDERLDLVRSVTDGRYVYVRNYMPHLIYGQHLDYMWQTPTARVWEQLHKEGKLNAVQDKFWNPKPPEELFDLQSDPDEVVNLADLPEFVDLRKKFRVAQRSHAHNITDIGFLPEGFRLERSKGGAPYDLDHKADYSSGRFYYIEAMADNAALKQGMPGVHEDFLGESDLTRPHLIPVNPIRLYWAVLGVQMRGKAMADKCHDGLVSVMNDISKRNSPEVRIAAARALVDFGTETDAQAAFTVLLDAADWSKNDVFTAMSALDALAATAGKIAQSKDAAALIARIKALPDKGSAPDARLKEYVPRMLEELRAHFP